MVALPVGIYGAVKQDSAADYAARSVAVGALSIPNFWLGTLIVVVPSFYFNWAPPIGNYVPSARPRSPISASSCSPPSASASRRPASSCG